MIINLNKNMNINMNMYMNVNMNINMIINMKINMSDGPSVCIYTVLIVLSLLNILNQEWSVSVLFCFVTVCVR